MPWVAVTVWHGSREDAAALETAIRHNCACQSGSPCGAHAAMLDQRYLDGVLFARFMRERLLREEGLTCRSRRLARTR
jgi:hypothetical protein